jgi:hypothetical protein
MVDDEPAQPATWRRGGLVAAVAIGIAAAVGIGAGTVGAGGTEPSAAPTTSATVSPGTVSPAPGTTRSALPSPPRVSPAPTDGPPRIIRATAADLQWTRAAGFLTCSGLVINVRVQTEGEVTRVLALLQRISGGATSTLSLSGSDGTWSASSLELNAPSVWRIRVVALGPDGLDERTATVVAPDGGGTTLRHVCPD